MAKINGTLNAVLSGANKVLHVKNATLTTDQDLYPTSTKDDAGWETHGNGMRSWLISIDGLYDTAGSGLTPDEIMTAIIGREADTVIKFTTNDPTNTIGWTGNGTFRNMVIGGEMEQGISYSCEIKGNGALAAL